MKGKRNLVDYVIDKSGKCICHSNYFLFHITTKDNMESISKFGLLPMCKERSKIGEDSINAIYFF